CMNDKTNAQGTRSAENPSAEQIIFTMNCPFPEVFENRKKDKDGFTMRPESEIVYSRSDYNHRWWTTWWDCKKEKPSAELVKEIDRFQSTLFAMPEFKNLDTMRLLCETAEATSDPTEFNLYSETEHFHIWLRMITRFRDYNLYVHFYLKQDI
ncbi:MAG: hypothetical protein NC311_13880, partial [Muribaculaceae bacterium]|nr:hypothetical protein [Muribaculaceae bacterium]